MSELYSSKRIVMNTIMLYLRMMVMMVITFYTTRVLLDYLGLEDFGIYNVVMGVITLFSFISTSMTVATQRFISYELGILNFKKVSQVFSASVYIYILVIVISVILFETIGLWYIVNYINVPLERQYATMIIYQLAIIQFIFMTLRIPYNSAVIAYEKMSFYAYISIIEAVLSLILIYAVIYFNGDKLIIYASLVTISKVVILSLFILYCKKNTIHCKLIPIKKIQKSTFKEIYSFSGWNIFGSLAVTANGQGINLIINYFAGVVVNASVGISTQLTMGLYNLVGNLQTAFNPQLIKLYAANETEIFRSLLYKNSRYCFYLFLFIIVPLYITIDYTLIIWLGKECLYASEFCRCMLIFLGIEALAYPLAVAIQADGRIKTYQILAGLISILLIPISLLLCVFGFNPISIFVARIFQNVLILVLRYIYLQRIVKLDMFGFFRNVVFRCLLVVIVAFPIPFIISKYCAENISSFILIILISLLSVCFAIYSIGLTCREKYEIKRFIKNKLISR